MKYVNVRNIAFICDDNYVLPTCVAIQSIKENRDYNANYLIHVCTVGLSVANQNELMRFSSDNFEIVIHIIDDNDYNKKTQFISEKSHVTKTALIKFELANILKDIDTVLYLDSDIIAIKSIEELFGINIDGYFIAAVFEFWKYQNDFYSGKAINIDKLLNDFYFNSGVMLLNIKKIREENVNEQLWNEKMRLVFCESNKSVLMDQDVLNTILGKKCLRLPIKYNCNNVFAEYKNIEIINRIYGTSYHATDEYKNDLSIIHFVGKEEKPWKYKNVKCKEMWDGFYINAGYSINDLKTMNSKSFCSKISNCVVRFKTNGIYNTVKYIGRKILYERE